MRKIINKRPDLFLTAGYALTCLITLFLLVNFSSCRSRKTALNLEKTHQESDVKSEINLQEQTIDKSTFEKFLKEHNYDVVLEIREDFLHDSLNVLKNADKVNTFQNIGQSADNSNNRLKSRYVKLTINSNSKEGTEKGSHEKAQNKSLQAKKDSSGTSDRKIKNKSVEAKSAGISVWFSFGVILISIGLLAIFWKRLKNLSLSWIFPL